MDRLQTFIRHHQQTSPLLLCSHAVMGYPDFDHNHRAITAFCAAGCQLIELQFPFSDPMADGAVLLHANQKSVAAGTTVDDCFDHAANICQNHDQTGFLIMTYYNIVFSRGLDRFAREAAQAGLLGVIIPDLPVEEAEDWQRACQTWDIAPIFLVTPETSDLRLAQICQKARGMIYCVARKGITGAASTFGSEFFDYIDRVRRLSSLPLAVGFGIRTASDMNQLAASHKVDVAMVCSRAIQVMDDEGIEGASQFLAGLRSP